jgi:hypothetical protein
MYVIVDETGSAEGARPMRLPDFPEMMIISPKAGNYHTLVGGGTRQVRVGSGRFGVNGPVSVPGPGPGTAHPAGPGKAPNGKSILPQVFTVSVGPCPHHELPPGIGLPPWCKHLPTTTGIHDPGLISRFR